MTTAPTHALAPPASWEDERERAGSPAPGPAVARPRLSAWERLELLCDPGTVCPLNTGVRSARAGAPSVRGDGVLAATGRVAGDPVFCYASDPSCLAGSLGERQADIVVRLVNLARRAGAPVVGVIESAGARLQEGIAALDGYGRIFRAVVAAGARVPQISIIAGVSAGGGSYCPALTDFVVMSDDARMFLTGPKVVRESVGEDVTAEQLGGASVHERNGVCHFVEPSLEDAIDLGRELLGYLPAAADRLPRLADPRPPAVADPHACIPAEARRAYDIRRVIAGIVDDGRLLEVSERWARNLLTGFARLEGRAVGVIANQPRCFGGLLDVDACQKGARFIETCDRLAIPLVVLVDTPGFMPGTKQESTGVIRHGAALVRAFAAATVPRLTLVVRKAYGGAYIAMNSKGLGADMTLAWPDAEIGIMSARQAVGILHRREIAAAPDPEAALAERVERYAEAHLTAESAAADGVIDEVIAPEHSREQLAWALSLLTGSSNGDRRATL